MSNGACLGATKQPREALASRKYVPFYFNLMMAMKRIGSLILFVWVSVAVQAQPSDFGYRYWGGGITLAHQDQNYARGNYASNAGAYYGAALNASYLVDMADFGLKLGTHQTLGIVYHGSMQFGWGKASPSASDADVHFSNAIGIGFLNETLFNATLGIKALVPFEFDARLPAKGIWIKPTLDLADYHIEAGYLMPIVSNPNSPEYGVSVAEITAIKKIDDYFGIGIRYEVRQAAISERASRVSLIAMF